MSDLCDRDQRNSNRIDPKNRETTVWLEYGKSFTVSMLDESFSGIGVRSRIYVEAGEEVEIDFNGVRVWAIVRHASPLEDAYRLGLAWKAEGVARKLRNSIEQAALDGVFLNSFVRMLPGGLSMMWKLFERGKWTQLSVLLKRMRKEAAVGGVSDELMDRALRLQSEIDSTLDSVTNELLQDRDGDGSFSNLELKIDSTINSSETIGLRQQVHGSLTSLVNQCVDMTAKAVAH